MTLKGSFSFKPLLIGLLSFEPGIIQFTTSPFSFKLTVKQTNKKTNNTNTEDNRNSLDQTRMGYIPGHLSTVRYGLPQFSGLQVKSDMVDHSSKLYFIIAPVQDRFQDKGFVTGFMPTFLFRYLAEYLPALKILEGCNKDQLNLFSFNKLWEYCLAIWP